MKCSSFVEVSKMYLSVLAIPGNAAYAAGRSTGIHREFFYLMNRLNLAFLASVVLSTFSAVALLPTAAQTTANRVFKAGFAGFGTLALFIALYGAYKFYQSVNLLREQRTSRQP